MSDKTDENKIESNSPDNGTNYALDDERRVKVLSPGAMVAKRFFRNRIAVVGLAILAFMFLFSFLGGLLNPYKQDQLFYNTTYQKKDFAGAVKKRGNPVHGGGRAEIRLHHPGPDRSRHHYP